MDSLEIGPELVGRKVCNPACPGWGVGTVLRVQSTTLEGKPRHRVSIQFAIGHRVLLIPPARIAEPPAPQSPGWLDTLAGKTPEACLARLPVSVTECLGAAERLAALAPLYAYTEDPASLGQWAQRQTQVPDPLSRWSRDELLAAFERFCAARDGELRTAADRLTRSAGPEALENALAALPAALAVEIRRVLARAG